MLAEYCAANHLPLIPVAQFNKPHLLSAFVQRLWGEDAQVALDVDRLAYDVLRGSESGASVVILSPNGEILVRAIEPARALRYYSSMEGKPPVVVADFRLNIQPHLDESIFHGLTIPAGKVFEMIVSTVNNARFGEALKILKKLPSRGDIGEFKSALTERIGAVEARKLALMKALEESGDKWAEYKVGESFLRVFPKAKEAGKVKSRLRKLKRDDAVEDQLEAREMFYKVAEMCCGSKAKAAAAKQKRLLFAQIARKYPDTEYGAFAKTLAGK